jgi:hypothetical protein
MRSSLIDDWNFRITQADVHDITPALLDTILSKAGRARSGKDLPRLIIRSVVRPLYQYFNHKQAFVSNKMICVLSCQMYMFVHPKLAVADERKLHKGKVVWNAVIYVW